MTKEQLTDLLSRIHDKNNIIWIANNLVEIDFSVKKLIEITFNPQLAIGFRAAWLLDNLQEIHPTYFEKYVDYFMQLFSSVTNPSCRRHFVRILKRLLQHKNTRKKILNNQNILDVTETCFTWLTDAKTRVAVRVHCMDVLYELIETSTWIQQELYARTSLLTHTNNSPGIQTATKRLLKKLMIIKN